MVKMQQQFGAKISTNNKDNRCLSYVVFLKKKINRDLKIILFNKLKKYSPDDIWTNTKIDYIVVLLNCIQKNDISKDPIVSFVGEVSIDMEKLSSLMQGKS